MRRSILLSLTAVIACGGGAKDDIPPPVQLDSTGALIAAPAPAPADTAVAASTPPTLTDQTWVLVTLGDSATPPPGAGGRPATLRLESAGNGFQGFAGCNRYSGQYVRGGADSLRFGNVATTRMACATGEELERAVLGVFPRVTTATLGDSSLSLSGFGATLARWVRQDTRGRAAAELAR